MVALLMSVVCLSSCSEDDDDIPSGLVGTWKYSNSAWTYVVTFSSNGTYSESKSSKTAQGGFEGEYTVSGSKITVKGVEWKIYRDGETMTNNGILYYTFKNGVLKNNSGSVYTRY